MKKMSRLKIVVMVVGLLCAGLIFETGASAADKNACSADVAKYCKNIKPGPLALMECLEKNEKKLTSACKEYEATLLGGKVEKREKVKEMANFRKVCRNDMVKFCNDADPMPQGGMLKCLGDHENEISSPCSQSLKEIMN